VVMAGPVPFKSTGTGKRGDRTPRGQRLFWGRPAQVRAARRFVVAGLASLAGHPGAHPGAGGVAGAGGVDGDLVALLVSEVVTNAVVHSAQAGRMGLCWCATNSTACGCGWKSVILAALACRGGVGMGWSRGGGGDWRWWRC